MNIADTTSHPLSLSQELSQLISKIAAKELDFFADEGIEVLHDFRVDLRKLRSWLQIIKMAGYPVKKLQKHSNHCHSIGGELRNFDVLIHWVENNKGLVPTKLLHTLHLKRKKLKKVFLKELVNKNGIRELRILGRDFLTHIKGISKYDFEPHVARYINENWEKFTRILPESADDLAQLHEIRKILKKVRYSLSLLPTINADHQHVLKELQDMLGFINDRRVWIELVHSQLRNIEGGSALEDIFREEMNDKMNEFRVYIDSKKEYLTKIRI